MTDSKKAIYTLEQWQTDHDFKADPGQEITEAVYTEFLNVM